MEEREVTYHVLTAKNAPTLRGADVFDKAVDPDMLSAFVSDTGHEMIFAATGADVIGFASGNVLLHPDKPPAFFVSEVGVEAAWRRQGIATALVDRLIRLARDRGCRGIWLATETDNVAARALYRRLAARETGAVVVYDWDGAMDE
ncbi:GNAT family N-acetyltransferase [Jannaschia sp. S6380]|uniref:GNAT family N-acetyltransferase n=1 Tax=Jannaschia sp. S6380 TaxID=2926408 RepID=UPI001FF5C0C7|nr:GNAT family N-acetyltransferase [Jannaschia sp. S6380]MCK0168107.1 GNAT family N-acetyltransferase [Jannaschia sp. S6380]